MGETPVLIPMRNSEVSTWKECRQKWWWAYVDCLKSRNQAVPLQFGTLMHAALELRYPIGIKRGPSLVVCVERVWAAFHETNAPMTVKMSKKYGADEDGQIDALELAIEMAKNYMELYGKDDRYKVIAAEQTFQVDVFDTRTGDYLFTAVGTIDGVWFDRQDKVYLFAEHKTGGGLQPFGAPVALDDQSGAYWAYGPIWLEHNNVLKGKEFDHILFNRMRKAFADTRPKDDEGHSLNKPSKDALAALAAEYEIKIMKSWTGPQMIEALHEAGASDREIELQGDVSRQQPEPLFLREKVYRTSDDRISVMERFEAIGGEMRMVRNGELQVYKMQGRHCNGCQFRDMCEIHEMGSDWEAIRDSMFVQWEPYAEHMAMMSEEEE